MKTAIARRLMIERQRVVARQYDRGGWLIALQALTIEIDGEPLVIPAGHHLTREQALNYPGDVQPAFNQRVLGQYGIPRPIQAKNE
jgi:hypothetical protein